jgi:hypothetical protein
MTGKGLLELRTIVESAWAWHSSNPDGDAN